MDLVTQMTEDKIKYVCLSVHTSVLHPVLHVDLIATWSAVRQRLVLCVLHVATFDHMLSCYHAKLFLRDEGDLQTAKINLLRVHNCNLTFEPL